ncbi:hypothetical protein L484_013941 [Morus notabilis]|uniref:Uncharacterized protein n=1 Tax=Morus notabilis TaxID=981085 RepID=W9R987_9ROSA|nr:hypothetical protein L484_013941 [Morus notabilis]
MVGRGRTKNSAEGQENESASQPGVSTAKMAENWMQVVQTLIGRQEQTAKMFKMMVEHQKLMEQQLDDARRE